MWSTSRVSESPDDDSGRKFTHLMGSEVFDFLEPVCEDDCFRSYSLEVEGHKGWSGETGTISLRLLRCDNTTVPLSLLLFSSVFVINKS